MPPPTNLLELGVVTLIDEDREIRLSRFGHVFKREDVIAIVHSLTSKPVYIDPSLESVLTKLRSTTTLGELRSSFDENVVSQLVQNLAEAKLVVPCEYDEVEYLADVRKEIFRGPNFSILFMVLTEACNLRCTYCFIEGGKPAGYHNSLMTTDTAIAAVDAFVRWQCETGDKNIVFYGGEPTLNLEALFAALERVREKIASGELPENMEKILITNGTLLTLDLVESLAKEGVFPYISLDGPPEIHNRNRPYANRKGSFDDAVRGLELFRSVGIEPGVSITVTEEMLDNLSMYLEWLITELGVKSVGFNMLEAIPGRTYFSEDYGERFADALLKCQEVCSKYEVYEERIMRKVKQFAKQEIYVFDCAACGEQLTVAPDGQVGVCQAFVGTREFFSGNVTVGTYDPRVDPVFVAWSNVSPVNRDSCFDCPALGLCGGGCPRNPYINDDSIDGVDSRFCGHVLKTQEWIIFNLYDKITTSL